MYYKFPDEEFLTAKVEKHKDNMNDNETNDFSPGHLSLHNQATANVRKKTDSVTATLLKKSPNLAFKLMDVYLFHLTMLTAPRWMVHVLLVLLCQSTRQNQQFG